MQIPANQEASMVYSLATQGSAFSTRPRAVRLLADLQETLGDIDAAPLTLDFEGVRDVSFSFVDEFVATLIQRALDEQIEPPILVNMAPAVHDMISLNLRSRGLPLVSQIPIAA
jgi:hypothetical protein